MFSTFIDNFFEPYFKVNLDNFILSTLLKVKIKIERPKKKKGNKGRKAQGAGAISAVGHATKLLDWADGDQRIGLWIRTSQTCL